MTSRCAALALVALVGCGPSIGSGDPHDAAIPSRDAMIAPDASSSDAASIDVTIFDAATLDLMGGLLTLTQSCTVASNGRYAKTSGNSPTVDICKLNGAFFWSADMDIDCDGQMTAQCNHAADPYYQDQTSFTQSDGHPLVASVLPYVVIPLASSRFDFAAANIKPGAVVAVLYGGKLSYGVFGDEGPSSIIGEASYAMAQSLGIDPDPSTGGVGDGVTYIAFTGASAVAVPIEDHQAAVSLGQSLATTLLQNN